MNELIDAYNSALPLQKAVTPPSAWYVDETFAKLENDAIFGQNWLVAGRVDQLQSEGDYIATEVAGEPIVIVKSDQIRAFYNVCRHHAALVMESGTGCAKVMQCPYHGWNYGLDGKLHSTPQFAGAEEFDKDASGLVPVRVAAWEKWLFVCLDENTVPLEEFLGSLYHQLKPFNLDKLKFYKRVSYDLDCNWKVFVDNYLDGGYHVPVLHKGLNSALEYKHYRITTEDRYCLQDCPTSNKQDDISTVRTGDKAHYYWQYPNLMINLYEGVMDTNIAIPLSSTRCRIYFDYYFDDDLKYTEVFKQKSVEVAHQVQIEDEDICVSVQRGLASNAYDTGRLSPEKEAGEHLFHRLLHQDLMTARSSRRFS